MNHTISATHAVFASLIKFSCGYQEKRHDGIWIYKDGRRDFVSDIIYRTCVHCEKELVTEEQEELILTLALVGGVDAVLEYLQIIGFKKATYPQ